MKTRNTMSGLRCCASGIALIAAVPAMAQNQSEAAAATPVATATTGDAGGLAEIIVTAEKRVTSAQKTAIAITALDGEALAQRGKVTLEDALRDVAGVTVQTNNNSSTYTIRGIRPAAQTDPAVNVNRDGIFQSNDGVTPNFDTARIEVLKGPQGTLYGRNAVGGVVNVVNTDPKFENDGYASLMLGNYNAARAEAALNVALSDNFASRTSAYYNMHDGYLSNGNADDNTMAVRQKLRFQPNSALNVGATGEYDHTDSHGTGTVFAPLSAHPDSNDYYSPQQQGRVVNSKHAVYGNVDYDFGLAVLSIIPSYYKANLHADTDLQGQGLQAVQVKAEQDTQEVRLSAPSSSPVAWQAGGYHLHYHEVQNQFASPLANGTRAAIFALPGTTPSYSIATSSVDSLAAFAQATAPVFDGFRLTGGVRYTRDTKKLITGSYSKLDDSFLSITPQQRVRQSAVTWKAGVEYDVAPRSLLYADVSKGFKSGGLNQLGVPDAYATYAPEKLYAYEAGMKNRFLNNRLQLNFDAFYYDYASKQFQAVQPRVGNFPLLVTFSGAARSYGGEVQADWQFTSSDRLSGAIAYTKTKITKFDYTGYPSQVGQRLENTPTWSGNATYEHVFAIGDTGELTAAGTLRFQSGADVITDIVEDDYQHAFQKVDLTLSYHNRPAGFTLTVFGNNVTNKTTRSRGFPTPDAATLADTLILDPPRTYGVTMRKDF